jgi:hypothetical protein
VYKVQAGKETFGRAGGKVRRLWHSAGQETWPLREIYDVGLLVRYRFVQVEDHARDDCVAGEFVWVR